MAYLFRFLVEVNPFVQRFTLYICPHKMGHGVVPDINYPDIRIAHCANFLSLEEDLLRAPISRIECSPSELADPDQFI